jgi:hypothetical protein
MRPPSSGATLLELALLYPKKQGWVEKVLQRGGRLAAVGLAYLVSLPLCFYDNTYGWELREKVKAEGAKQICAKYSIDNKVSDRNSQ